MEEKINFIEAIEVSDNTSDGLIIGYDRLPGENVATLIVGRKRKNNSAEIINAFQNEEAIELYERLITIKKKEGTDE